MLISLGAQESGREQIAFTLCIFSYAIIILKYHLNGDKIFMLWTYQSLIWPFFFYCGVQWHGLQFLLFRGNDGPRILDYFLRHQGVPDIKLLSLKASVSMYIGLE